MLEIKKLTINRGNLCVAKDVDFSLQKGKVYALLGPNGAGKSSMIGAIFGELKSIGDIAFEGKSIHEDTSAAWKKNIGYMPQDTGVDASLSALEVVLLGLMDNLGVYLSDEQIKGAANIMQQLGILHLAQRDILNLSGGQRQMVMFAQVLLRKPKILLLDEPVSALDMHHQCVLLDCVRQYTHKENLVTLMVLHDLSLAAQFADELIVLLDTKILAQGNPKSVLTQQLVEKLYRVHADIFYDSSGIPVIVAKKAV